MKGRARACSLLYRLFAGAFRNEFYGFPKAANPQGSPGRVPPSPRVLHPNLRLLFHLNLTFDPTPATSLFGRRQTIG